MSVDLINNSMIWSQVPPNPPYSPATTTTAAAPAADTMHNIN